MTDAACTVFVVDDDPSVRKGVQRLLRSAGFSTEGYTSAQAFLDGHDRAVIGCVILDLTMPGISGLQMQEALADSGSVLPIVFLTGHGDIPTSVRAMKHGAVDFLTKPVSDDMLLGAVRHAIERATVLEQEMREKHDIERRLATLTPREREVLTHLVRGRLNKQIAADLGTVEKTIKVHRARVMQKMQVRTLVALARLVQQAGIAVDSAG
ncbi:MAG: response regulator transcription factor [Burkholderiales bacterium]|nr:response regulator transcription factor [Burkholderiales bacterium]